MRREKLKQKLFQVQVERLYLNLEKEGELTYKKVVRVLVEGKKIPLTRLLRRAGFSIHETLAQARKFFKWLPERVATGTVAGRVVLEARSLEELEELEKEFLERLNLFLGWVIAQLIEKE